MVAVQYTSRMVQFSPPTQMPVSAFMNVNPDMTTSSAWINNNPPTPVSSPVRNEEPMPAPRSSTDVFTHTCS